VTTTATEDQTPERLYVASLRKLDSGGRADLRRCLAAETPSGHLPAYRHVEKLPWVPTLSKSRRDCYYLVGGLFALVERQSDRNDLDGPEAKSLSLARAVKIYELGADKGGDGKLSSVERRFLTLLDSDEEQLPYRLRQMVQMITRGQNAVKARLDWAGLLKDLQSWNSRNDWVRQKWAREFYQSQHDVEETQNNEESQS
jgi:CRISPR system Cascade subunit CasB